MPFNTWAIDGDVGNEVFHPASVARVQTYVSFDGREGVVGATDLRVLELSTPGTSIRVMPGSGGVLNRAVGGARQEYAVDLPSEETVAVTATGAGVPRSDLVIARVENPFLSGEPWVDMDGPFTYARIIEGVDGDTKSVHDLGLGYSAITLARIDIPESTATITQSMIKDLRSTIGGGGGAEVIEEDLPATQVYSQVKSGPAVGTHDLLDSDTTFEDWPPTFTFTLPIPSWATYYDFEVRVANAICRDGDFFGEWRFRDTASAEVSAPFYFDYSESTSVGDRVTLAMGGTYLIPSSIRGDTFLFQAQARSISSDVGAKLQADKSTYMIAFFHFKRLPTLT